MYSHNDVIAFGCQPITIFHGEDYVILVGGEVGFGFNPFKSVGHFVKNAVKTAGREIGHVSHTIQAVGGQIGKGIGHIPIIGGPLHTVFDVGFSIAMGPSNLAIAIAIDGKRIDKAVLANLKQQLHDFKQAAPYAQMVISIIPGIGQGVSAALSAGLALAEGQSIVEAIKAGAIGAIPGGPLVKAAVTMGVETIQHVAKGERVDFKTIAQTAGGVASSALGLPVAAKNAITAGMAAVGGIASGKPIDKAFTDGAIMALPIADSAKKAMVQATVLISDIAHGKGVNNVVIGRMNAIAASLPPTNPLAISLKAGIDSTRKVRGKNEEIVMAACQSGLGDTLLSMGATQLPPHAQKGLKAGIAMGSGITYQGRRHVQLGKITGKLTESGIQLAKSSPLFDAARKLAHGKGGTQGFDHATGLLQQQVGAFDIATVRDKLTPPNKLGFDMALSVRIGAVANPKPKALTPAAHAGHAMTLGMQSYEPAKKAVIMKTIESNPSATVGALVAVKEVAAERENWLTKLFKALGLAA